MRITAVKKTIGKQQVEARKRLAPSFEGSPIRIELVKIGHTNNA
jgi:hypothetical protein